MEDHRGSMDIEEEVRIEEVHPEGQIPPTTIMIGLITNIPKITKKIIGIIGIVMIFQFIIEFPLENNGDDMVRGDF